MMVKEGTPIKLSFFYFNLIAKDHQFFFIFFYDGLTCNIDHKRNYTISTRIEMRFGGILHVEV